MRENKFFQKFLENLSKLDESNIKSYLESVESERRQFKDILDRLDEGLMVLNHDQVVFINNEALSILGMSKTKFPLKLDEMKKITSNQEILNFLLLTLFDEDYQIEISDGNKERRYYRIEKTTEAESIILIKIKDITDSKKIEFRLKSLESFSALNTMAAGIAHEIKNPLTAIDLHTQIIKKAIDKKFVEVPQEVLNYIHIIDEEQKRMGRIVNDFLVAARKRELQFSFEDVNDFLKDIIKFIEPEIQNNQIEIVEEYTSIPDIFIDKDYLRQAILNLLKNAIESMANKRADFENYSLLKILKIRTFYDHTLDSVGISISDTGDGIETEKLEKIFEPYYSTKEYGTGLGLTIVYKIVKEHGGDIKVESEKAKGSCFTIYLPLSKGPKLIANE